MEMLLNYFTTKLQSSNLCCLTLKYRRGRKENIETFSDKFNKIKFEHINNNFRFEWECHKLKMRNYNSRHRSTNQQNGSTKIKIETKQHILFQISLN